MTITWPSDTVTIIDEIRDAIGREIEFRYLADTIPCSACHLDPVTGESDDAFCTVCSGLYYIETISGYTVSGVITWSPSDRPEWQSGGTLAGGDCIVQVKITDEILEILPLVIDVEVDGKIMEIKKKMMRGVKELNRILLSLIEKEE